MRSARRVPAPCARLHTRGREPAGQTVFASTGDAGGKAELGGGRKNVLCGSGLNDRP